tara:strand:- start:31676 stop:31906 length:231 start_codon:yes stop_codon:yes gene_type:complete
MNIEDIKIGMKVRFGRKNLNGGKMTEGVVVKINTKTVAIRATEDRSYGRGRGKRVIPTGSVWRTTPSIISRKGMKQ